MKASELIEKLQELVKEHGDIEVTAYSIGCYDNGEIIDVKKRLLKRVNEDEKEVLQLY